MSQYDFIAVYIMASGRNGTLYVGSTSDLERRVSQHKNVAFGGFSAKYGCKTLVWYERHGNIAEAIGRERLIKHWLRAWKLKLIEDSNPEWRDLSDGWYDASDL
jgi:putative endonuclease